MARRAVHGAWTIPIRKLWTEIESILSDIVLIEAGSLVLHDSVENLRQSAYMLEGNRADLQKFSDGKKTIGEKSGETENAVIIYGRADSEIIREARNAGLRLSAVSAEDLCVYLTSSHRGVDLECLWQKTK